MRFGEELRSQRERRGISLDEVAVATRVSLRHLSALEEDRFTELPGGVFSRGIVRSYAQCCGLDSEGAVKGFLAAMKASGLEYEQKEDDWVGFAEAVRRNRTDTNPPRRLRWAGVVLMIAGVFLLAAGVLWLLLSRHIIPLPLRFEGIAHKYLWL